MQEQNEGKRTEAREFKKKTNPCICQYHACIEQEGRWRYDKR